MIYPSRQVTLRSRIPTVRVHVVTDDGDVSVRARWNGRPIDLQRRIAFLMRQGQAVFLEDERGRTICLRPECIWGATVYGRTDAETASFGASSGPWERRAGSRDRTRRAADR